MATLLAIYGSPRRKGNTARLLERASQGAVDVGAQIRPVHLRELRMSPCLATYGCKAAGRCVIQDDFQEVYDLLLSCDGLMLASPIFFYAVSAQTKILIDRCQALWVRKHALKNDAGSGQPRQRKALFIAAGATRGPRLFDGTLLTVRYFLSALDTALWKALLYRGLDAADDVAGHPDYLQEAYQAGQELARVLHQEP